jgi:hypothetical protein
MLRSSVGLRSNTHSPVDLWLAAGSQDEAESLRDRLLSSDALSVMHDNRIHLQTTAWSD